jgi:hypothetical protein
MDLNQLETFNIDENDTKCVRFLKRKFKCILIYLLLLISLFQLIVLIFEKVDDKYLNILLEKLISKNRTFNESP